MKRAFSMSPNNILPFYMTYPYPMLYQEEDRMIQDLEYIQQLYPQEAKVILAKVIQRLDRIDYPNSIIYDEYPDQIGIYQIASAILLEIVREREERRVPLTEEAKLWLSDLIKLVLYQEIFKRRYQRKNGYLRF